VGLGGTVTNNGSGCLLMVMLLLLAEPRPILTFIKTAYSFCGVMVQRT